MMGHLIAAAGAVASVITLRFGPAGSGIVPADHEPASTHDPECDLDYIPNKARKAKVNVAMSNSFGFGGQNDTVIVKRFG